MLLVVNKGHVDVAVCGSLAWLRVFRELSLRVYCIDICETALLSAWWFDFVGFFFSCLFGCLCCVEPLWVRPVGHILVSILYYYKCGVLIMK